MDEKKIPPVHPGEILLEEFLKPMDISQYRLARDITVPPRRINEIVHGKRSITADTALRLGRYFGISPQFWLNLQAHYDLEAELDKIAALDAGADDYLTKPFGTGELLARMRVVQRRQINSASEPIFSTGGLIIDFSHRLITVNGKEIQLTPTEYDLLRVLVTHAGKVLTHRQLLRQIWGEGYDDMHILRVNISNLRAKIEPDPARPTYIHTEPGVGYRIKV